MLHRFNMMSEQLAAIARGDQRQLRRLGSVHILSLELDDAIFALQGAIQSDQHVKLAFANSHVVNVAAINPGFSDALRQFMVLPDGIGVDLGSRLLCGAPFAANLNGTDFIPRLIARSSVPLKIGLVGAKPGVAERAMARLASMAPQHTYWTFSHGFFAAADEPALLANLAADRPDILLVAFGNPHQEMWIAEKLGHEHCAIAAGVGALFDFLAGEVVRAPRWIQRMRFEWLFRLGQEPVRLWGRYIMGNPIFLMRMLMQKWRRMPSR